MMRRRPPEDPNAFLFNGKRYRTRAEYEEARTAQRERRRRLVDWVERERNEPGRI